MWKIVGGLTLLLTLVLSAWQLWDLVFPDPSTSLAAEKEDVRKAVARAGGDVVFEWSGDLHGSGASSYLLIVKPSRGSDELHIYDFEGDKLHERLRFQPEEIEPGGDLVLHSTRGPLTARIDSGSVLSGSSGGGPYFVGAVRLPHRDPPFRYPFVTLWDAARQEYRLEPLFARPLRSRIRPYPVREPDPHLSIGQAAPLPPVDIPLEFQGLYSIQRDVWRLQRTPITFRDSLSDAAIRAFPADRFMIRRRAGESPQLLGAFAIEQTVGQPEFAYTRSPSDDVDVETAFAVFPRRLELKAWTFDPDDPGRRHRCPVFATFRERRALVIENRDPSDSLTDLRAVAHRFPPRWCDLASD